MAWTLMMAPNRGTMPVVSAHDRRGITPGEKVRDMIAACGEGGVPRVVQAIMVARADAAPAIWRFDSRPYGGVNIYWLEQRR